MNIKRRWGLVCGVLGAVMAVAFVVRYAIWTQAWAEPEVSIANVAPTTRPALIADLGTEGNRFIRVGEERRSGFLLSAPTRRADWAKAYLRKMAEGKRYVVSIWP